MAMLRAKTKLGEVEGVHAWNQSFTIFKGIPFAAPPVGNLRWKAPQPAEGWEGVRECFRFSATPMEGGPVGEQRPMNTNNPASEFFVGGHPRSEDCLYLNVWTPAESSDEKLPVAVYIHGGGYSAGYSFANAYDGEGFNKRGIVYVSIAYRVNCFGFMAHPEMTAESENHASGNYGLLDQIAGIKWVRENIAAFGGDPEKITIFGQSAGGMSITQLCASPLTTGLYSRAIIQSAGGGLQLPNSEFAMSLEKAEEIGTMFFEFAGFNSLAEARKADAEYVLEKMNEFQGAIRKAESGELVKLKEAKLLFQPNVDGYVLPTVARETYLANNQQKIDYMIGSAQGDAMLFGDPLKASIEWAENLAALGNTPAYVYYFTYVPPGAPGAHHSVEHHYVFQTLMRSARKYTGFDFDLSNELADYWANFIKTGNPNGDSEQKWLPCTAENQYYLEIAKERILQKYNS